MGENCLNLFIEVNDVITYAIQQNGLRIVRNVNIKNNTEEDIQRIMLKVSSDNELIIPFEQGIETIQAGKELKLSDLRVIIKGDYLASLTERVVCILKVEVCHGEDILAVDYRNITALAYDEWPGLKYFPDMLAAFVTPNHPVIAELLQLTSRWLQKWTGQPSLEGYQCQDANRVKNIAAAAYAAIQEKNITYANPPSSFEVIGQRVRLCDTIMEQHIGTCMDMTLLYASILEAIGLNPVLVLIKGHIFAGVWLVDETFSDPIVDDPSQLEKRMAVGINELIVVECTAMCSGKTYNFDTAIQLAVQKVGDYTNFQFAIDVLRARRSGVRPLPIRVKTADGYEIKYDGRKECDITARPEDIGYTLDMSEVLTNNEVTRQIQWERKLLDLSMRNMLINMRLTKAVVPLLTADFGYLEDTLADGEEFQVTPRPMEWDLAEINIFNVESTNHLGPYKDLIALECKRKRLPTIYTEKELNSALTKMYRSAKTSMEENGASTLYLALGLLRWFEKKKGEMPPRYAPIILIPIDITRKSASKGYTMRMRDEDAQINITMLEFLKQNYDIVINGLNPIPMDEHGLDMKKIFSIIRHAIMDETMWNIVEAGFIGNFSFSQFVMWNDIHNKTHFLESNKIIHSLMKGAIDWDCSIPDSVDTDEAYLPITADSSQIRAINMAANDVSFVLHGPPGTGKSQTITAMIANALTKGKTVLFVAEKMAALEVVQKRLENLGINNFCLELHSNKATKRSVLDQLHRGLEISVYGLKTEYASKIDEIRQMREDIDSYARTLHEKRRFGKSLRELIDLYEMVPDYGKTVFFDQKYVGTLTQGQINNQVHILERLVASGKGINHPSGHPLSVVGQTVYSQTLKLELEGMAKAYRDALGTYRKETELFAKTMKLDMPVSEEKWVKFEQYAKGVLAFETIPTFLMQADNLDEEFFAPEAYVQKKDVVKKKQAFLITKWNQNFLQLNMNDFRRKYDEAGKKIFGKGRAIENLIKEIQAYASFPIVAENIPILLTDILIYQKEKKKADEALQGLSTNWKVLVAKYTTANELYNFKEGVKYQFSIVTGLSEKIKQLDSEGTLNIALDQARRLCNNLYELKEKEQAVVNLLQLSFNKSQGDWVQCRIDDCNKIISNAAIIKDWIVYKQFSKEARQAGLSPICDAYEQGLDHEEVIDVYLKSVYKSIVLNVIESEPVLNNFTGIGFNERIVQFKKLDKEFMELTKDEMWYKLTHNLPSPYESVEMSKELNILRRAISSNGRGISIRSLFEQIPNVLKKLCPCMLMSPISVAQYLEAKNNLVDIVIFDEASQLPTCKAVGVLARGKNAIIVGDPNQMPPTSFFAGNTIDEDNLDMEDLDSILDDCLALGMPQSHLKWHYRSRHESLIAFSNHEFYENQMLTFPSVNDREKRVSMVKVNGFFDRGKGRVNQGEAEAIVKEIKCRYKDSTLKDYSIGVVTFNISQQTIIEDMLAEEFQRNADLDHWANAGEEKLFVKNLENVQGDERDIILFSIAFGPDSENKISMNFGPLNKAGGWKRLNVAVSRARSEMIVFSTMTSDMIDLRRTKSKGVESLKNFLEFAEKGKIEDSYVDIRGQKNQGITDTICRSINEAGFEYQKSVGHSNFKIDIAVLNPYNKDEYLLGIMLDGESYHQSANTKDREISQMGVLSDLRWELTRVWTMDWWDNRDKEINRIMQLLDEKKEAAQTISINRTKLSSEKMIVESDVGVEINSSENIVNKDANDIYVDEPVGEVLSTDQLEIKPVEPTLLSFRSKYEQVDDVRQAMDKSAGIVTEKIFAEAKKKESEYVVEEYVFASMPTTPVSTTNYILKATMSQIEERLNLLIEKEAPISYDRLIKKTIRSFDIARSSPATIEATEKALKKISAKLNKQNGLKFYWRENQNPDTYYVYRNDTSCDDSRTMDDISQQELKNAVCKTILDKGAMEKDILIKETIHTMGFGRTGAALVDAVERGLKYGRKTGEIVQDDDKRFCLPE
ncbi:MAG: DUF4011 domain-containing protein [Lachnospiraceae bacterium]